MANYSKEVNLCYSSLQKKYRTSKFLSLDKKYRSHFEIIALMLEATRENCTTRFHLMKNAGINCAQLKKYLRSLTEIGFIDVHIADNHVLYRTSEKGLDFLRQYHVLLSMLLSAHSRNELSNAAYGQAQPPPQIMARLPHPH